MGVLGELFPGPKIRKGNEESGTGERWQLGPIDLDKGTVVVHRAEGTVDPEPEAAALDDGPDAGD